MRIESAMRLAWLLIAALCIITLPARAQDTAADSAMEKIGDERYRIGTIIVDRNARSFTVPGKILNLDEALEYIAVSRNGSKGYESLLELDTSPRDFNLACILIGLDDAGAVKPRYQFDEVRPAGQSVRITLGWEQDGEMRNVSAANALQDGEKTFTNDSWVYIGSAMSYDGRQFMAEIGGTLIGFVHDPNSIIEHSDGAGIGAYGSITGNETLLPPEGATVSVEVAAPRD